MTLSGPQTAGQRRYSGSRDRPRGGLRDPRAGAAGSALHARKAFAGDSLSEFVDLPTRPVSVVVVATLTLIATFGNRTSARANATLTVIEAAGLVLVITLGVVALGEGGGDAAALTDVGDPVVIGAAARLLRPRD